MTLPSGYDGEKEGLEAQAVTSRQFQYVQLYVDFFRARERRDWVECRTLTARLAAAWGDMDLTESEPIDQMAEGDEAAFYAWTGQTSGTVAPLEGPHGG